MSRLQISALTHAYDDKKVVQNVSVLVESGELVCLLGPSGCGKTTLLRVAAGLENIQSGEVYIADQSVASSASGFNLPPEKRGVGLMFQDYALFPHLTVMQNILFGVKANPARQTWAQEALEQMGLKAYANAYPHTLSGGQQQRVALLRAIAPEPGVLFLDEPFSGLDVTRRATIREETLNFLKKTKVATLMVTHDPEEAMFMADRILVMNHGRIIQNGTPDEIYFHPNSPFVTRLFGTVNQLNSVVEEGALVTPLGRFSAENLNDGIDAQVLIRPEGLQLTPSASGFEIVSSRSLGRASHIVLRIPNQQGSSAFIEARVPGTFLPAPGSQVSVSVAPEEAYVFAAD